MKKLLGFAFIVLSLSQQPGLLASGKKAKSEQQQYKEWEKHHKKQVDKACKDIVREGKPSHLVDYCKDRQQKKK